MRHPRLWSRWRTTISFTASLSQLCDSTQSVSMSPNCLGKASWNESVLWTRDRSRCSLCTVEVVRYYRNSVCWNLKRLLLNGRIALDGREWIAVDSTLSLDMVVRVCDDLRRVSNCSIVPRQFLYRKRFWTNTLCRDILYRSGPSPFPTCYRFQRFDSDKQIAQNKLIPALLRITG